MTIEQTMAFIHDEKWRGSKPGLRRIRRLLAALGNPEREVSCVHIAGTNGKGSTAACLESILRRAGYKTGLYTSPYIREFGERIRVNGENIPPAELCALAEAIRPTAEGMADRPTEFELVTAMAFLYFARQKCELVVLEAGLGGKEDATNVIPCPAAAVLTPIALDHTRELGPDITSIARAKGGIIKEGGLAVFAGNHPQATAVLAEICRKKNARLHILDRAGLSVKKTSLRGSVFSYGGIENLRIPLAGAYQPENAALALETARLLAGTYPRITEETIRKGLAAVRWPGRFETLREAGPAVILDGGHNPHGVKATADSLRLQFPGRKVWFLLGVMADKDVDGILALLLPLAAGFVTVTPENPRAMAAEALAARIRQAGGQAEAAADISGGAALVLQKAGKDGVVCAMGTLYFSADARRALVFASTRLYK